VQVAHQENSPPAPSGRSEWARKSCIVTQPRRLERRPFRPAWLCCDDDGSQTSNHRRPCNHRSHRRRSRVDPRGDLIGKWRGGRLLHGLRVPPLRAEPLRSDAFVRGGRTVRRRHPMTNLTPLGCNKRIRSTCKGSRSRRRGRIGKQPSARRRRRKQRGRTSHKNNRDSGCSTWWPSLSESALLRSSMLTRPLHGHYSRLVENLRLVRSRLGARADRRTCLSYRLA
jgi:hypothetical protein